MPYKEPSFLDHPHAFLQDKVPILKKILSCPEEHGLLHTVIQGMPPSEVAYLIHYLDSPNRKTFVHLLKKDFDPEIFLFLEHDLRQELIAQLSAHEIAAIVHMLESDDGLSVLGSLDEDKKWLVLSAVPEAQRSRLVEGLGYPAASAGRLMQLEVLTLSDHWTLSQSLRYLSQNETTQTTLSEAFVVDSHHHPIGLISLMQLIRGSQESLVKDVMDASIRPIPAQWTQEEVALTFRLYDLMSAPVVDQKGRLIGVITADDVIDVIERKATEDLYHMGRIHGSDLYRSVWRTSLGRIHWLIITLANTLLTSLVINEFQTTLQNQVALTVLMPVAAAMGGNAGIQASTIIIRALATKEITRLNIGNAFFKELRVALLNGSFFGLLLSLIGYVWFDRLDFAITLGGAVLFNMMWAGMAGTLIPMTISQFGYDPALSAGPLLTTTTDVIGYLFFLGLASMFMG